MNDIILLKLGEVVLKGGNRHLFETRIRTNISRRLRPIGDFEVYFRQSTIYVEPKDDFADMDEAFEALKCVFGPVSLSRARPCDKNLDSIFEAAVDFLGEELSQAKSFKVESRRADKSFPMTSIQLSQEIGGRLKGRFPRVKVDVHHPEMTVYIEIRDYAAYVHSDPVPAAGGMPLGSAGRGALLLSGGIDSPVAGYMMARRGLELECVHFFSYPYTSEKAREKVLELAQLMCRYTGRMTVCVVPFTKIQEAIRDQCPENYFTIIMRRYMMRIAQELAKLDGCKCLITGESLGQVASQTTEAMAVTGADLELPVFRPVIGMDKEEIVTIARKIGTFETSILPYEDCCTVFTPKHPKTKPNLKETKSIEAKMDFDGLVAEAVANTERVVVKL